MSTKVTSKGQVTIPKAVRDLLDLKPGSEVRFRYNDNRDVILERADGERPPSRFEKLRGHAGPGPTTDEIIRCYVVTIDARRHQHSSRYRNGRFGMV